MTGESNINSSPSDQGSEVYNPDKTEVLLVGGSGFGEGDLDLVLNGVALPLKDKVRSLGVLLDPELSLEAQVTAVARSTFFQLRLIHQLRPYLENGCLVTVTHALEESIVPEQEARYYSATILQMSGVQDDRLAIWLAAVTAFTNFIFTLIGVWLVEKVGRRKLTLGSLAGTMVALVILALGFLLSAQVSPQVTLNPEGPSSPNSTCTKYRCLSNKSGELES
ncbi:Proton myo-inositol cotransporter [Varanus komodoensis]|nr:Proton myo-inositol cotransporter [Varanus komodoensis]